MCHAWLQLPRKTLWKCGLSSWPLTSQGLPGPQQTDQLLMLSVQGYSGSSATPRSLLTINLPLVGQQQHSKRKTMWSLSGPLFSPHAHMTTESSISRRQIQNQIPSSGLPPVISLSPKEHVMRISLSQQQTSTSGLFRTTNASSLSSAGRW